MSIPMVSIVFVLSRFTDLHSQLLGRDYNCDSTTIRLRYDDTTTHSTTTEVIEITIRLRYDYDRVRRIARTCFHSTRFDAS